MADSKDVVEFGHTGFWSVVIPTYNRLPILLKCLRALEQQTGLSEVGIEGYEVVVVDDGSTDSTICFLSEATALHHEHRGKESKKFAVEEAEKLPHVRLILQDHGGAAMARNTGIRAALGSIIIFIDSDMVVTPSG